MVADPVTGDAVPHLRTHRLVLRPWCDEDVPDFAALNADPQVMEHFPATLSRSESDVQAARIRTEFRTEGFGWWVMELPGEARFIGFTGLNRPDFKAHFMPCVEIGWRMARAYWGRGLATEAAWAAVAFGFQVLKLAELVSFTAFSNQRSQAVMRRLGMTSESADDFDHPAVPHGHRIQRHVLYRLDVAVAAATMPQIQTGAASLQQ